jgi:hypothetical protein
MVGETSKNRLQMRYGRPMRRRSLALSALVLVLAGSAGAARTAERPVGEPRTCSSRGEGRSPQRPAPAGSVRIGPLFLWPSIWTTRGGRTSDPEWRFAIKAPVVLPARARVVLAVAPEAHDVAAFQHGSRYVAAIRFEACRERVPAWAYAGTVGKLTGFPFAIGLKRRSACVPMELWIDGRDQPLRKVVPVGRRSC